MVPWFSIHTLLNKVSQVVLILFRSVFSSIMQIKLTFLQNILKASNDIESCTYKLPMNWDAISTVTIISCV